MTIDLHKPRRVKILVHPRAPAVKLVQYSNGTFILWSADGSRRSPPYAGDLRSFTSRGWHPESMRVPGQEGSLFELAQGLLDRAKEESDRDLLFEVNAP